MFSGLTGAAQRVKNREGKTQIFCFWARQSGQIFLGSQKSSQMAAFVCKSKNVESSLNLNNLLSNKYPISMFDLGK